MFTFIDLSRKVNMLAGCGNFGELFSIDERYENGWSGPPVA